MFDVMVRESKRLFLLPQSIGPSVLDQDEERPATVAFEVDEAALAARQQHLWVTTRCGQRFTLSQIGSMFGRE